ncbi:AAA family ATPase [Aliarcobacter cryaerophilus]|uniref:AAA family ATPase n=1 Tax=Aliarcobacter cryaerophilus TaxID=28198 RepID=UPI003DA3F448
MELVYLWVEDYKNIHKQGFNFSPRFRCEFKDEYEKYIDIDRKEKEKLKDNCELIIEKKEHKSIFPDNINITAIVGENGSGKSSVLEILKYGNSLSYDFKTKKPYCFYILYDEIKKSFIFQGVEGKQDNSVKSIFYIKYSNKMIDKIFQNIYYSSNDTFYSYPEFSTNYQISENITNITNAYMYEELTETIQRNHNHKLTSYLQLMDYLKDIHIENGIHAFYKNNINVPNSFNRPTYLVLQIKYKYIYTSFTEVELEEKLHKNIQKLMSKFEQDDRNNIEYMIKHISILSILIQYDRGLKNTVDFKIEDFFNDIDFTSSKFEIIDKIIFKLNKKYIVDGVENNILEEYFESILKIINLFQKFTAYYKNEEFFIPIDLESDKILQLVDLHKNITATISGFFSYRFEPFMSSGHNQFFNFFAKLFYALNYQYDSLPNYDKKILLFLDEPDIFLHPDWQKKYINILINFLNTNYSQYKFHIIITSHSPFILSDLPKENVIFLEKYNENDDEVKKRIQKIGNCKNVTKETNIKTFGANIHTLLSNGFFMKDGLMGEFAKNKISKILNFLNGKNKFIDFPINQIKPTIELIGEDFLREKLLKMYNEKLGIKSKDDEIKELKAEIERLKDAQNKI